VRSVREAENKRRRREARTHAQAKLDEATTALTRAEEAAREPHEAHQSAKMALRGVREKAIAEFERVYPEPTLNTGIKPEGDYLQYLTIIDLRQRGWGFGHEIDEDGSIVADAPANVDGLVAREPRPARERVTVACPKCGKRQRIPKREDVIVIKCPCGERFDCKNGRAVTRAEMEARHLELWVESGEPERWVKARSGNWDHADWLGLLESLKGSAYWPMDEGAIGNVIESLKKRTTATGRDRILELARAAHDNDMVTCPVCKAKVKAKNLVQHYDKLHKGKSYCQILWMAMIRRLVV